MSSIYTLMLSSAEFQILVFWLQNITRVKVPNQNNWKTQGGADRRQAGSLATDRRQGHLQLTEGRVTCNRQKAGSRATDRRQARVTSNRQKAGRVTCNRQKAGRVRYNRQKAGRVTCNRQKAGRVTCNRQKAGRVTCNREEHRQRTAPHQLIARCRLNR